MTEVKTETFVQTETFVRTPFQVEAVCVTEENMADLAAWCNGDIRSTATAKYIKVHVHRPWKTRETQAFVGDWIVVVGKGFKVYTKSAFAKSFVPGVAKPVEWDIDANQPVDAKAEFRSPSEV